MYIKSKKSKVTFLFTFLAAGMALVGGASNAQAANGCFATTVVGVLDYSAQCGGKGAFLTAGSGGNWICGTTDLQIRLATAAYLSGKPVYYQLGGGDNDCNPDSSYSISKTPLYFYMQ